MKACPKPAILALFGHELKNLADQVHLGHQSRACRQDASLPKRQVDGGSGVVREAIPSQMV